MTRFPVPQMRSSALLPSGVATWTRSWQRAASSQARIRSDTSSLAKRSPLGPGPGITLAVTALSGRSKPLAALVPRAASRDLPHATGFGRAQELALASEVPEGVTAGPSLTGCSSPATISPPGASDRPARLRRTLEPGDRRSPIPQPTHHRVALRHLFCKLGIRSRRQLESALQPPDPEARHDMSRA